MTHTHTHTHTHKHTNTNIKVQRSANSKDRVKTNGRTDRRYRLLYLPANAVGRLMMSGNQTPWPQSSKLSFIYLFIYLFSNIRAKRPLTICTCTSNKISKLYIKLLKNKTWNIQVYKYNIQLQTIYESVILLLCRTNFTEYCYFSVKQIHSFIHSFIHSMTPQLYGEAC